MRKYHKTRIIKGPCLPANSLWFSISEKEESSAASPLKRVQYLSYPSHTKIFQPANHYHNQFIHLLLLFCTSDLSWKPEVFFWITIGSRLYRPVQKNAFLPACCFAIPSILFSLFFSKWQRLSDREGTFCYCKTGRLLYTRTDFFTCTLITRKAQSINGTNNSFCFACRNWKVSDAELRMLLPFLLFSLHLFPFILCHRSSQICDQVLRRKGGDELLLEGREVSTQFTLPKMKTDRRGRIGHQRVCSFSI